MKTRPTLIISAIIILLVGGIVFFVHLLKAGDERKNAEIVMFLKRFDRQVKSGNTDSLLTYFDAGNKVKMLKRLANLLAGKVDMVGVGKPPAGLNVDVDASDCVLKPIANEITEASIPIIFSHQGLNQQISALKFEIKEVAPHQYKIIKVSARKFLSDYNVFESQLKLTEKPDPETYADITLKAFRTAGQLKGKYDSVVWFAHLNNKTWFYVVNGTWKETGRMYEKKDSANDAYKMGLLNPDLKVIIPVEYHLIHNINGTFDGMIEVEKDHKRGFYNLSGKLVVPVNYDQIFPIADEANMAVLRTGSDYFYLKKDNTVSGRVDLKLNDFFSKITGIAGSFNLKKNALSVVTEYNSRAMDGAVYIPASYLVDLNIAPEIEDFKNPLRGGQYDDISENYEVSGAEKVSANWFEAAFYSIRDYFLGGRSEFYDRKSLVIVDKKSNRVFSTDIGIDYTPDGQQALDGPCNVNSIRQINDSLFEVRGGASLYTPLYDSTTSISGGPYYHYLLIKGDKLVELPDQRVFGFTKYVKMDDSYLQGCYNLSVTRNNSDKPILLTLDHVTPEMLKYMKNEIFANYHYQFKDRRWKDVFDEMDSYQDGADSKIKLNANVDDSLTVIDKYNINWIAQKLKGVKVKTDALAGR